MQGILKLSINICTSSFCIAFESIVVSCCKCCKFVASTKVSIASVVPTLILCSSSSKSCRYASWTILISSLILFNDNRPFSSSLAIFFLSSSPLLLFFFQDMLQTDIIFHRCDYATLSLA